MATETEKQIQSIKIELTSLKASLENLRVETTPLRELASQVQNLKLVASSLTAEVEPLREIIKKVAVIEHQLAEMTKTKELWGQRGWMVTTICLSAGFSFLAVVLGGLLTFYFNSKR